MELKDIERLVKQYNSDSKSRSANAESKLLDLFTKYINDIDDINMSYQDSSKSLFSGMYNKNSGSLSIIDIYKDYVTLVYEDFWRYGGYCREVEAIYFNSLLEFNKDEYRSELVLKEIKQLEISIKNHKKSIENNYEKIRKLEIDLES